jgi:flavin-dependent dehydrogenase
LTADLFYDVVVAGAGPAGASSAIVARQAGLRVGLVDDADDADDQALKAGESLPGSMLRTLRRLGINGPADLLNADELLPTTANASAWGSDMWTFNDALASPEGGGWHVLRHRFDRALRQRAVSLGVERLHATVSDVEHTDGRYRMLLSAIADAQPRRLGARFLADATGRRAAIARKLGVKRRRLSQQCAAVAWLRHPEHDLDNTTRVKAVRNGWWYSARLPQMLRVLAFHGLPTDVAQLMKRPQQFVEQCNATDLLSYEVRTNDFARPLKAMDASVQVGESAAGPGWLAVGDAALAFDPLSSQGVLFALYSGIRGVEAVLHGLAQPELAGQFLDEYQQNVHSVLAANQRARMGFYRSERRYADSPYWRAQRQGVSVPSRLQIGDGTGLVSPDSPRHDRGARHDSGMIPRATIAP